MTRDLINVPAARSWRDIPQPVKPRAMSRGGRWRLYAAGIRVTLLVALLGAMAWGIWKIAGALQGNPEAIPATAKQMPVRAPELITDGAHTSAWLARTLALPDHATLMELDLDALRGRLLGDGQVLTARLTRHFPDRLLVQITERAPVARVMAEWAGRRFPLLVARDGIIYPGEGYAEQVVSTLPWLDGVALARSGEGFEPIAGMQAVADLLAKAQLEAPHLYRTWNIVSLARLEADRELEVRTSDGMTIVFSAVNLFLPQLARLDYMAAKLAGVAVGPVRIDLSLGREVPVRMELPAAAPTRVAPNRAAPNRAPAVHPAFSIFPTSPSKPNREL